MTARIAAAMMMLLLGLLSGPAAAPADSVSIDEMAFRDQPITDILLALAEATGTSIVPDHTVRGRASYRFQNTSLEAALEAFLPAHRLYTWQEGQVHFVSRVRVVASETGARVTVDANQVSARTVVEMLAQRSGLALEYGALPDTPISVHARKLPPEAVLRLALSRLPRYALEKRAHGFAIVRADSRADTVQQTATLRHGEGFRVSQEDSGLRVWVRNGTTDRFQSLSPLERRYRGEERLRVWVGRSGKQSVLRRLFHDSPEVHYGDAMGNVADHPEVVTDEQIAKLEFLL